MFFYCVSKNIFNYFNLRTKRPLLMKRCFSSLYLILPILYFCTCWRLNFVLWRKLAIVYLPAVEKHWIRRPKWITGSRSFQSNNEDCGHSCWPQYWRRMTLCLLISIETDKFFFTWCPKVKAIAKDLRNAFTFCVFYGILSSISISTYSYIIK